MLGTQATLLEQNRYSETEEYNYELRQLLSSGVYQYVHDLSEVPTGEIQKIAPSVKARTSACCVHGANTKNSNDEISHIQQCANNTDLAFANHSRTLPYETYDEPDLAYDLYTLPGGDYPKTASATIDASNCISSIPEQPKDLITPNTKKPYEEPYSYAGLMTQNTKSPHNESIGLSTNAEAYYNAEAYEPAKEYTLTPALSADDVLMYVECRTSAKPSTNDSKRMHMRATEQMHARIILHKTKCKSMIHYKSLPLLLNTH